MNTKLRGDKITQVAIFTTAAFLVCGFLFLGNVAKAASTIYVDEASTAVTPDGSAASPFKTISDALSVAVDGDVVDVAAGTYTEAFQISHEISIVGAGSASVTIDASKLSSGFGSPVSVIYVSANNVSISGISIVGLITNNAISRAIKSIGSNFSLTDVKVSGMYGSGIDINGSNTAKLDNVSSVDNRNAGMVIKGQNIILNSVTTNNNPWGGIAISNDNYTSSVTGIVFTGTNSFGESNDKNGGLYIENTTSNPITYGTSTSDGADVIIQPNELSYIISGAQNDGLDRIRFYGTLDQVHQAFTIGPDHLLTGGAYIKNIADGSFNVFDGMDIQDALNTVAPGGTVTVAAGTYTGPVAINRPLTLNGAQAGVDARTRSTSSESIIESNDPDGSIQIGASGPVSGTVTVNGFTIGGNPAKAIHVRGATDNVIVEDNIIEPATTAGSDGNSDGINLYSAVDATVNQNLVLGAYTSGITMGNSDADPKIATHATVTDNKIEDAQYGITGYAASTTISGNTVIGTASRIQGSGIGGNFYDTSIAGNTVSGYLRGVGIAFQNPYTTDIQANSYGVTVSGNEVYGNYYNFYAVSPNDGADNEITGNYFESPASGDGNAVVLNGITSGYSFSGNYYSNWDGAGDYPISAIDDPTSVSISATSSAFVDNDPISKPLYVSDTGSDSNIGTESQPYLTIGKAITEAVPGGVIYVGPGTYNETLHIDKPLKLYGSQHGHDATVARSGEESIINSADPAGSIQIGYGGAITGTVTIDGFTISGPPAKAIHVVGVTDNVVVKNNIIEDATTPGTDSNSDGINLWQAESGDVEYNWVKGANTSGITGGDDNNTSSTADGVITQATIAHNKVDNAEYGITGYLQNSKIYDNVVVGNSSLMMGSGIGGQFYNTEINNNNISGYSAIYNGQPAGVGLSFDNSQASGAYRAVSNNVSATNNVITGNSIGIYVNQPLGGNAISVSGGNKISDNTAAVAFNTGSSGALNANHNWWGTTSSTELEAMIMTASGTDATLSYSPMSGGLMADTSVDSESPEIIVGNNAPSTTSTVSVPAGVNNATLDASALLNATDDSVTLPGAITVNAATTVGQVNVQIPAGIKITGASGWTGVINVPQVKANSTVTVTPDSGNQAIVGSVIEIGSNDVPLTFNDAVRILIAGQAYKDVGYYQNGTFTKIANACANDSQATGNALPDGGDCKMNVGSDLVIWTKHFTSFVTYTQAVIVSGGGGGGYVAPVVTPAPTVTPAVTTPTVTPTVTTPAPTGQVLGAAVFRFTRTLDVGAQGADVTELQNLLTAQGVYSGPVTGYYGPLTAGAVRQLQAKYGISQVGAVGPLTMAKLNELEGNTSNAGQVLGAATSAATQAQITAIQTQLASLIQQLLVLLQAQVKQAQGQ